MQLNQVSSVKCFSFNCKHNRNGRCGRGKVTIYDNTVRGLCLHHTDNMTKRILEPVKKIKVAERVRGNSQEIDKIIKRCEEIKNQELLKNPKAFGKWLKRHGIKWD